METLAAEQFLLYTHDIHHTPPTTGSDPTKAIEELAKRRKIKTLGVSMGQGQELVARRYIASAAAEGHWVLLQNAHLGVGYLHEVEQVITKGEGPFADGFRLWITAEPHPAFPMGLLQAAVKLTNEAPMGMRAGLRASWQWITQVVACLLLVVALCNVYSFPFLHNARHVDHV